MGRASGWQCSIAIVQSEAGKPFSILVLEFEYYVSLRPKSNSVLGSNLESQVILATDCKTHYFNRSIQELRHSRFFA